MLGLTTHWRDGWWALGTHRTVSLGFGVCSFCRQSSSPRWSLGEEHLPLVAASQLMVLSSTSPHIPPLPRKVRPLPSLRSRSVQAVSSWWEPCQQEPGHCPLKGLCLSRSTPPSAQAFLPVIHVMHVAPACLDTDGATVPKQAVGQ